MGTSQRAQGRRPRVVRVLDADPDLGLALAVDERRRATDSLLGRLYKVEAGTWELRQAEGQRGALGLLVADGLLALQTSIDERTTLELVGRGDLLQPWVKLGAEAMTPPEAQWHILEPSEVILLDRGFAAAAAEWPEVIAALMHRLVVRSRRLCYQLAVNASPRVEDRVLYMLWALADRWGRVTQSGVVLTLNLTHQRIAELVCAQRPSISTALNRLRDEGRLSYSRSGFTLHGKPPASVSELKRQVALEA